MDDNHREIELSRTEGRPVRVTLKVVIAIIHIAIEISYVDRGDKLLIVEQTVILCIIITHLWAD